MVTQLWLTSNYLPNMELHPIAWVLMAAYGWLLVVELKNI